MGVFTTDALIWRGEEVADRETAKRVRYEVSRREMAISDGRYGRTVGLDRARAE